MKLSTLSAFVIAALLLGCAAATAQTNYSENTASTQLTVGAGAAFGVAVPVGSLDSIFEPAPGVAFRVGANLRYPIDRTIGLQINAGFDSRSVGKKVGEELDARNYRFNYFFIEPGVSISAFRVSLNVGLPLSGSEPGETPDSESLQVQSTQMEMLLEPRVGATLVLMDDQMAWLGLTVDAGVHLNQLYKNADALVPGDIPATRPFTAHIGLTYQFAIPM